VLTSQEEAFAVEIAAHQYVRHYIIFMF